MSSPGDSRPVRFRDRVVYAISRAVLFVVSLLPERPAYWLVGAVGRLYFRCSKRRQAYALRFLRNAYPGRPDRELLELGRVATGNVFKVSLDTVRVIPWLRSGRLEERLDFDELHGLPQPPFLGLAAHLGSWEMAAISAALLRGETHGIARRFGNPLLNAFIISNRRRAGFISHPKRGGIKALVRALGSGQVGLQVVDQRQRLRGVRAPFFGEMASCDRSAASLALRKGYQIAVGGVVRVGPGFRFRGVLSGEPFSVEPTGDSEADLVRVVTEVNRRLEQLILAHPEQYLWIHNRYRDKSRNHESAS